MMTKDEALRGLTIGDCRTRREAVKTVKELLNRAVEPSYNSIKTELKGDMISRQAICKIIDDIRDCISVEGYWALLERLKKLPPVNPQTSGDLISRQSAIFLASDLKQDLPDDEHLTDMVMAHNEGILEYQTQLSLLPSVNPQNCDKCEVGNPCLYCKHEFNPQERNNKK